MKTCKECLDKIYEFLDKDLDQLPMQEIQMHLDWCRSCWDRFEFEIKLKERVKTSCCKESCSEKLRQRIQSLLDKF